jgi:hypothetical protein
MLTSLPLGALSGLSSLQTLYIQFSKMEFTVLPPDTFSGLSSLKILYLLGKLQCAPLTAQARAALTIYYGPSNLCALRTCEAGKFSTICIPHCFTVDHQHRPVQCVHVFLAKYEHGMCQRMQAQVN